MKKLIFVLVLLFLSLVLSQLILAQDEVRIGVIIPNTGEKAIYGETSRRGLLIAVGERPAVLGRRVNLVFCDNKSDKIESANCAQKLIQKEKVIALIGPLSSSDTLSAGPVAEEAGIALISPWATNPIVTQDKKHVFRACFIDTFQGIVAAKFAREVLKAKTAAVMINVSEDYCVGLANFFKENFTKLGGEVLTTTSYQTGDQEFTAQLTSIKKLNPDIIYNPGYVVEDVLIARQAKDLGIDIPFLSGDAAEADELIKNGGDSVQGWYLTTHYAEEGVTTDRGKRFIKLYGDKYKEKPDSVSALSYDSYNMLLNAIERAKKLDSTLISQELGKTKDFEGVTGVITIENGNAIKPFVILKVEGNGFKYVSSVKPFD